MDLQPLLAPDFLNWISSQNFLQKNILEIGSGGSTLFFSKYFKNVFSFENDKLSYNKIKSYNISNIEIELFNKNIFQDKNFKNKVYNSDIILIDNNPYYISREDFTYFVHQNKKPSSYIVLDNGDWHFHAYEFLRSHYYCIDYFYYIKEADENQYKKTQTTIFYEPREKK